MPSAAPSRLPLCPAPCDPLSSCSFLWSWVQILSESISYLCGWEGISALAVNAEQEGYCNASRAGNTRGGGLWGTCNQGAALGRSSQFPAGRQGTGPAGRFSQLGDTHPPPKPPHQIHQNELGGCLCSLCPCLLRQRPVHNFLLSGAGHSQAIPTYSMLQIHGPAILSTFEILPTLRSLSKMLVFDNRQIHRIW